MNSHYDVVEFLLDKGAKVNDTQSKGLTALHYAAKSGDKRIVELLIARGADVNAKNVYGETPAHLAILDNHRNIVELLIAKGAEISTIQLAAYKGDLNKLKGFIEEGVSTNAKDEYGLTPLHAASGTGQKKVAEFLISKGASVNPGSVAEGLGTPLHYAADEGSKEVAELLVSKGANVDAKNRYGETALHLAALKGMKDVVVLLVNNGADVHVEANRTWQVRGTPLHYAALRGHKEVVEFLIDKGANIKPLPLDLLQLVCWSGYREMAEFLIQKGADVDAEDNCDEESSLYAVWNNQPDVLELLLAHGADVNAADLWGWSLLHYTTWSGQMDMTRMLLDNGADPNVIERCTGQTPLHLAVQGHHEGRDYGKVVELLINHGANVNAKDWDGKTPMSLAKENGHAEIAELLRKHGAKE
jgi:ankyrin repeat protein